MKSAGLCYLCCSRKSRQPNRKRWRSLLLTTLLKFMCIYGMHSICCRLPLLIRQPTLSLSFFLPLDKTMFSPPFCRFIFFPVPHWAHIWQVYELVLWCFGLRITRLSFCRWCKRKFDMRKRHEREHKQQFYSAFVLVRGFFRVAQRLKVLIQFNLLSHSHAIKLFTS